jgi:hypothetical protein
MSKQIVRFALFLIVLLMVGGFGYFYYVKPQREYIKINTQDCIKKAMAPINSEVNKNEYSAHYADGWFTTPLKEQEVELNKCVNYYKNIFFSTPEINLLALNINSMVNDTQAAKINSYKQVYASMVSQNKEQQAKIDKCNQLKAKNDKYNACMKKPPYNCEYPADVMNGMFSCALMGISF